MAADPTRRIARARARYDRAYDELVAVIREDTEAQVVSVTEAGRQARFSRYYIGQIRDGAAGDSPPRHHNADSGRSGQRRSSAGNQLTGGDDGDHPEQAADPG